MTDYSTKAKIDKNNGNVPENKTSKKTKISSTSKQEKKKHMIDDDDMLIETKEQNETSILSEDSNFSTE